MYDKIILGAKMEINKINGEMCNVYLIKSNINIVVDAGASVEQIQKLTDKVEYVFITHAHFDHIYFLNEYIKTFKDCKILLSEQAYKKLFDNYLNGATLFDINLNIAISKDKVVFIKDGDKIKELSNDNCFYELKGHTDCCLGLRVEKMLFSGDAIFWSGIGRYDLPTGSISQTMKTQEKLKLMNDVDLIYSGHGISPFRLHKERIS